MRRMVLLTVLVLFSEALWAQPSPPQPPDTARRFVLIYLKKQLTERVFFN